MDINFNGTIITLFGSLPLEMLGSQGGAGSGPSRLDVFCSKESTALAMGTCHSAEGEKKRVMEKWREREGPHTPPHHHTYSSSDSPQLAHTGVLADSTVHYLENAA